MHVRPLVPVVACLALPLLAVGCAIPPARAQEGELRLPDFSRLQAQAVESDNLTLGPFMLSFASAFMDDDDPQVGQVRKAFRELKSLTVRSFRFQTDVAQHDPGIEDVRRQLEGRDWSPLVQVHDRDKNDDVGIYLSHDGHTIRGLAILSVAPREVTLVYLRGRIDADPLARLRHSFAPSHPAVADREP